MAIIVETCPKCGHDLQDLMIATYPPIPKKECWNCGWSWEGEPEEVIRMPFGGAGKRESLNCIVDEITEKEIQEYLESTLKTMITNHVDKYYKD